MHMIHTIPIMQQSIYNMTIEKENLIPENETSNKSKNPAPDYDERTAKLRIRRLEVSREFLIDRAYTYITRIHLV